MEQQVISNNEQIFQEIFAKLQTAKKEILVATSWFTDDVLFQTLLSKKRAGVVVEVIISDNQENAKLDFDQLTQLGATVLRIKNVGYGIMHQKFCVIDREIALHGSYNWSINAKTNNHESIIVTNHGETVASLVKTFFEIKERSIAILNGQDPDESKPEPPVIKPGEKSKEIFIPDPTLEFSKILDSMIASEVSNFDRSILRNQGYERSQENNGDAQVLHKALDTVYAVFINDINVVEDKKKRLAAKIDEQKAKTIQLYTETLELVVNRIDVEFDGNKTGLSQKIANARADVRNIESEIKVLDEISLTEIDRRDEGVKKEIVGLRSGLVRPKWKLHELLPTLFFGSALFVYLFLFYSSAAYILIFSQRDEVNAQLLNKKIPPPEIFNADALSTVMEKGFVATLFVILFVAIPMSFCFFKFHSNRIFSFLLSLLIGVIIVDGLIAYKVASSIHEIRYLKGEIDTKWELPMVFKDSNFYLVFICGAFGLVLLKVAFDKLKNILDDRHPDVIEAKNKFIIKEHENQLKLNQEKRNDLLSLKALKTKNRENLLSQISEAENELNNLPGLKAIAIEKRKAELSQNIARIESTTLIYKSHVENDNLPLSIDAIKDRINVFMEGWNDSLYDEFAAPKANVKCQNAVEAVNHWLSEKLKSSLDQRIKHLN